MPPSTRPHLRSRDKIHESILKGDIDDQLSYERALDELQLSEKDSAFDALIASQTTEVEKEAASLLRKIRAYDLETTFKQSHDDKGYPTSQLLGGEHFLGNTNLINQTELLKVAKKMPKGAHLHVHFNSCLQPSFLIQQARKIDAMYIRSSTPLIKPEDFVVSRISFMVMKESEALQYRNPDGTECERPLGNIFTTNYVANTWMRYRAFQRKFMRVDETSRLLKGREEAEKWLEHKMLISEEEAHGIHQTGRGIWERFNTRTQMMKGLFAYESAFRNYTRACVQDFVDDNIQYAEIRPNFMSTNSLKSDDGERSIENEGIMGIINAELRDTMHQINRNGQYFGGMKVIYCTPRSFQKRQVEIALDECLDLKKKFGGLLCGFDLVGHEEMGNELRHFVPEFLEFRRKCKAQSLDIPFLFHCGETLQVGGKVDGNLYDAILLNSKRIGHGYALARHPFLMDYFKKKNIAIESCPISNEILGLTPTMAGHNLPTLLANDVPCTINSDNATFYKSSLSHDFYQVMISSESMSLYGWKQLAKWSLEHSCMEPEMLASVTKVWEVRWAEFCLWIVDEYRPKFGNWEPANAHLRNWPPNNGTTN
ncbi:adenosine deaminase family protein-like protein [Amylocarpus encephaloides]|uniref:Adenosine deaminase family protein-like protein n=1 Tax=Amylocarpus encephaloides TaxID=45428 RepID=A0A9P8C729_9HELO|nr:adenosine deaminase family protein-like protein [Amylocarpus encephaloides]